MDFDKMGFDAMQDFMRSYCESQPKDTIARGHHAAGQIVRNERCARAALSRGNSVAAGVRQSMPQRGRKN
jgi:hypothetical protein